MKTKDERNRYEQKIKEALEYRFWEQLLFDFATGKRPGEDPKPILSVFRGKYGWR